MPALDGFRVWLEVDGEALTEYPHEGDVDYAPRAGLVGSIQSYVISTPQKSFSICLSAPEGLDVQAELSVEHTTLAVIQLQGWDAERIVRETGPEGRFEVDRAFVFEQLDVHQEEEAVVPLALGTISVEVTTGGFERSGSASTAKPKSRKDGRKVLNMGLAAPRALQDQPVRFYPRERRVFVLKYNTRDVLEAAKKIPTEEQERHATELARAREIERKISAAARVAQQAIHAAELAAEREWHAAELAAVRERHDLEMTGLREQHAVEMADLRAGQRPKRQLRMAVGPVHNEGDPSESPSNGLDKPRDDESDGDELYGRSVVPSRRRKQPSRQPGRAPMRPAAREPSEAEQSDEECLRYFTDQLVALNALAPPARKRRSFPQRQPTTGNPRRIPTVEPSDDEHIEEELDASSLDLPPRKRRRQDQRRPTNPHRMHARNRMTDSPES